MADPIAASPAPAAPTPAPASAPTPSPAASPSPAPSSTTADPFMAELESKFKAAEVKDPTEPEKKEVAPAPDAKKEPTKAPTPTPEAVKPLEQAKPANEGPKALRERKEQLERELATERTAKADFERKLKDFEAKGKDTESLLTQIDEAKKQIEAMQAENRMLKQETSPEFKKQYDEPFNRAAEFAKNMVVGLDKADGTPSTWEDFAALYGVSKNSVNKAISEARAMFGENSQIVIGQLTKLHELNYNREVALQQEKAQWQERTKVDEGKAAEQRARDERAKQEQTKHFADTFQKVNKDLEDTVEHYRVPPEDKELNEARSKALSVIDSQPKDQTEFMVKNAHIRQRAAAFGVVQIQNKRLMAEVAELKKKLDETQPKRPGSDPKRPGGAELSAPTETWEEAARKAVGSA